MKVIENKRMMKVKFLIYGIFVIIVTIVSLIIDAVKNR